MAPKRQRRWSFSDLPMEVLSITFQKLTDVDDISRCATVCSLWQSVIRSLYHQLKSLLAPFMLLSISNNDCSWALFNTQTHKLHNIFFPDPLNHGRWHCSSSSYGWLQTISFDRKQNIYLLNPLTRDQIELPPPPGASAQPQYLKVITSTSPLDPHCVFLAGYSIPWHTDCGSFENEEKLYICRPGDSDWTMVKGFKVNCGDTICYKGEFYAVSASCGVMYHLNIFGSRVEAVKLPILGINNKITLPEYLVESDDDLHYIEYLDDVYLVELEDDLLLVLRSKQVRSSEVRFDIYRLDWQEKQWIKVKDIGDNAIFLGKHGSTSLAMRNFNGRFKANSICFIQNSVVVYNNLGTKQIESFFHQGLPSWANPKDWLSYFGPKMMASKDEDLDKCFIKILYKVTKGGRRISTLDEKDWLAIGNHLFTKFGKRQTVPELKSKYDQLSKLYEEFGKLRKHKGMIWDSKTNRVHASEDIWQSYIKENPFAEQFRGRGFHYYSKLCRIFENRCTEQFPKNTSSSYYILLGEIFQNARVSEKSEFLNNGVEIINLDDEDGIEENIERQRVENSQRQPSPNPISDLRKQDPSFVREHASIEECMKILEAMEDLDDDIYNKACEKFISIDWRRVFVMMPDARKRKWLNNL